jgi:transcriptional regulator with GAF, ATPase, and Fis domain
MTVSENLRDAVASSEREMILSALRAENWNQSAAAKRLNIPRRTLGYKIKVLGLSPDEG